VKKERISELMDGELNPPRADLIARRLGNAEALATWSAYHLIGDALRGDAGCDVAARVSARLAAEPTVLAARPLLGAQARHLGLSMAASVAAVMVVGWLALTTTTESARYDTLQQAQVVPVGRSTMDDYLALHQGEVRSVIYEPVAQQGSVR
jgi:sigma-E factor negative regulatory protein RseA